MIALRLSASTSKAVASPRIPLGWLTERALHIFKPSEELPVTQALQKAFFDVVTGKDRKRRHWLTAVGAKKGKKR